MNGRLGQVALNYIPGFTSPFPSYAPPGMVAAAPSGAPLYTPQINDPDFADTELHCYKCPDGTYRSMSIPAGRAAGCEARPLSECGSSGLSGAARREIGKARLGQAPTSKPTLLAGLGLAGFALGSHFVPKKNKVLKNSLIGASVLSGLVGIYMILSGK